LPISRWPRRQRPWVRTILVEVPVSSTNTRRFASRLACPAFQHCRASATSGRSCSAACRVFFEGHPMPPKETVDRTVRGAHSAILPQPLHHLRQGQVWLLVNQLQQPRCMRLQRRPALAAPPSRADAAGILMQTHPPDRRRWAHRKPFRCRPPRASFGNGCNHPRAKIIRIGASSHGFLRIRSAMDSQSKSAENPQLDHNRFIKTGECSSAA
jgi:hypothetical protein